MLEPKEKEYLTQFKNSDLENIVSKLQTIGYKNCVYNKGLQSQDFCQGWAQAWDYLLDIIDGKVR